MDIEASGTLLATGTADGVVKVWDIVRGYCTHSFRGPAAIVGAVQFRPGADRLLLAALSDDGLLRLFDLHSRRAVAEQNAHLAAARALAFTPEGAFMVTGGRDKVLNVWRVTGFGGDEAKSTPRKKPSKSDHGEAVQLRLLQTVPVFEEIEGLCAFSDDQTDSRPENDARPAESDGSAWRIHVVTAGATGSLRRWRFPDGQCIHQQSATGAAPYALTGARLAALAGVVCAPTVDQSIVLCDATTLAVRRRIVGHNDEIVDLRYLGSTSPQRLVMATNSRDVRVYRLPSFDAELLCGHTDIVLAIDCSPDGSVIVTGSKDKTVRVWHCGSSADRPASDNGAEEGFHCVGVGTGHAEAVGAVACGRRTASFVVTGSRDRTVKVWQLDGIAGAAHRAASLRTRYTLRVHDKDVNAIDVAPNDAIFATGSQDKTAKIWRVADGTLLGTMRGHRRGIWCVQFSPVDQCLATASGDKTVRIWGLRDYSCLKTFEGHANSVLRLCFLTHGMQLLSSGSDGLVKLWSIKDSNCVCTLDAHEGKVWALAVGEDGGTFASGGTDATLKVWCDRTQLDQEERLAAEERRVQNEQELANLLDRKQYEKAFLLALSTRQPMRSLAVAAALIESDGCTLVTLRAIVKGLSVEQLSALLDYARDWNTNARNARVAQLVLYSVFCERRPDELQALPGFADVVEALLPYTERHFHRMTRLLQHCYFIDYSWQAMRLDEIESADLPLVMPALSPEPSRKSVPDGCMVPASEADHAADPADTTTQRPAAESRSRRRGKRRAADDVPLSNGTGGAEPTPSRTATGHSATTMPVPDDVVGRRTRRACRHAVDAS